MKIKLTIQILLLSCLVANAQNLVLNGDFEQFSSCPTGYGQANRASFWITPTLGGTSDYLNQCASQSSLVSVPVNFDCNSYQVPHSGNGYMSIINYSANGYDYREYIEATLSTPLTAGVCYDFQMYVNVVNCCRYASDDLGVYFSDIEISNVNTSQILPNLPQIVNPAFNFFTDTANWVVFSGSYTAYGGETYLVIGGFTDDMYINTTVINTNSFYNNSFLYIDDVCLVPCGTPCGTTGLQSPTNSTIEVVNNAINGTLEISSAYPEPLEIIFYDISSRILIQKSFTSFTTIKIDGFPKGIYLYEVRNKNGVVKKEKLVKE